MKYLIVLASLLIIAYGIPPEVAKKLKARMYAFADECKVQTGATDDDIAPILLHKPPTTDKGKCFIACMNKKFGFQDASGKISKGGTYALVENLKSLDEDLHGKMKKVADICLARVTDGADECETGVNMFICLKTQEKEAGVII